MITSLYVKNIAIIKELNIDFTNGFSVLTGETGAGKSIIMDSIGILLGSRSIKGKIRNGEREAIIRGCFDELSPQVVHKIEEFGFDCHEGLILQRNFNLEGKSTVKVNGQTVTQGVAKEIGSLLITIHGQNDNQKLLQKSEHLGILDGYISIDTELTEYQEHYHQFVELKAKLDALRKASIEKNRLYDIYVFQAKEIDDVNPRIGEEEKLLAEAKRLENIEKIQKHSKFSYHVLRGSEKSILALLDKTNASVSQLVGIVNNAESVQEKIYQLQYELEDIASTVRSWGDDDGESAEKKLDKIGNRLNSIAKLKKKYGGSVEEVIAFRKQLAIDIDAMDNSDALIEETEKELNSVTKLLTDSASRLTKIRKEGAVNLEAKIMDELQFLEMPKVRFVIDIKPLSNPDSHGLDDVEFLISTNAGQPSLPMIKIASGGELSRIMLAIKSILLDKDGADSVIFDEIDTGISGKTSRKVGIKLKQIAKHIQVICVTHSAQIASLSDNHYLIYKHDIDSSTQTEISLLDYEARVHEVARILGGLNVTENQFIAAREMIEEGKSL